MIEGTPKEDKFLQWSMHSMGTFMIKNVENDEKLHVKENCDKLDLLKTDDNSKTFHWSVIRINKLTMLKNIDSEKILEASKDNEEYPKMTCRKFEEGDFSVQWILLELDNH